MGKKEVLRSLKTADPVLAEQRATKIRAELYAEWSPSTLPAAIEVDRGLPPSIRPDNTAMIREANKAGYELHFKNLAVRRHEMAHASREDFAKYKEKKAETVELYA